MDIKEFITTRCSIRNFTSDQISDTEINEILTNAQRAPSAGNLQAYRVFVIKDLEYKEKVKLASFKQEVITSAPVVFIVFAEPEVSAVRYKESGRNLYAIQDATIFACYLEISAKASGFDSVWLGGFEEDKIKEVFDIKDNLKPVAIIPIGKRSKDAPKTIRRNLEEIVKYY